MGQRRKNGKIRIAQRRSDSKLTRGQIYACHTLYKAGLSVPQVAGLIWQRFNFKSLRACINTIYHAFYGYRLETRSLSQANNLRWGKAKCVGCGCPFDDRTRGCITCRHRHAARRKSGNAYLLLRERCAGCGGEFSNYTKGCKTCTNRKSAARRRLRQADPLTTAGKSDKLRPSNLTGKEPLSAEGGDNSDGNSSTSSVQV